MENASKALIIAGAILLSILLISLGIMIFNQAQSAIDGSGMSDAELQAFNSKFLKYEGKQKGSVIRSMVQEVVANNNSAEASEATWVSINVPVYINGANVYGDSDKMNSALINLQPGRNSSPWYGSEASHHEFKNTKTYTVSFKYYNGRIVIIQVK